MRRNDTQGIGETAEQLAKQLLTEHGFVVVDLNERRRNYPVYDLLAEKDGRSVRVSVKCARAKRELRLGSPASVARIEDGSVLMAFLPRTKGAEIEFISDGYDLLIVPGAIARDESLAAHNHYAATHPGSKNHSVMVKDKIDRSPGTRSGAVFRTWFETYKDAWHVFEASGE